MKEKDFTRYSYENHEELYKNSYTEDVITKTFELYDKGDILNDWYLQKSKSHLDPVLEAYPKSTWLTVGDGLLGVDARYIQQKGLNVLATDISPYLLERAKNVGFIEQYQQENAEALSFDNNSFDFCFAKETLHHLPRPYLGFYEMVRVAKKGVFIIECCDDLSHSLIRNLSRKIRLLKNKLYKKIPQYYESSGNYVYGFSEREFEKMALGLNIPCLAIKPYNYYYLSALNVLRSEVKDISITLKKLEKLCAHRDLLCKLHIRPPMFIYAIFFKEEPDEKLSIALKKAGYNFLDLPKNPYLKAK